MSKDVEAQHHTGTGISHTYFWSRRTVKGPICPAPEITTEVVWVSCESQEGLSQAVSSWHTGSSRLNSTYLRIARQWSTVICNHAAGFNSCLLKIQENMNNQLKAVKVESKGKTAAKVSSAVDELQFLLDFNSSVCQAMAKSMEHLTEFLFVTMANTTLLRRDSYLAYLKASVKADTLHALRTAPLHLDTLFPDSVVKRAEEDITSFDKGRSTSVYKGRRYHPYERQDSRSDKQQGRPAWKNLSRTQRRKNNKGKQQYSSHPAKGQQQYKWQSMCNSVEASAADQELYRKDNDHYITCKAKCSTFCS